MSAAATILALFAGIAGSIQIAVMGRFGGRVGTLEALAFSTLLTALLTATALVVVRHSLAGYGAAFRAPTWLWIGAAMGAFIVFTITIAAPRIGTTATIGLLIAGQLGMGATIDRFGLFGGERIPLHAARVVGIVLLAAGAALSLRR